MWFRWVYAVINNNNNLHSASQKASGVGECSSGGYNCSVIGGATVQMGMAAVGVMGGPTVQLGMAVHSVRGGAMVHGYGCSVIGGAVVQMSMAAVS